jgi:hypothetical protein
MNSQTKLHLPRGVGPTTDHAPDLRTIDIQTWVGGLKVIQDVVGLDDDGSPTPSRILKSFEPAAPRFQVGRPPGGGELRDCEWRCREEKPGGQCPKI